MRVRGGSVRFARAEEGVISAATLILFPILLFAVAVAIDMTNVAAEKKYVQGQADLAAMSAIRNFGTAEEARSMARQTIAANPRYDTLPTPDDQIVFGTLADGTFTPAADQTTVVGADAVKVSVRAPAQHYLLGLFTDAPAAIVDRSAVAQEDPRVSFALTNCLLEADLLKPVLEPLIGAQLNVLCSGRGVDTAISGNGLLDALAVQASALTPSGVPDTYGDILDAQVPVATVLSAALGEAVPDNGQTIRLGDVIYMPADLRSVQVGQPLPPLSLNADDLVLASAELLAERVATLDTTVTLPSVGQVQAHVTVGDPRQMVLGATPGDPDAIARTSQIRLELPAVNVDGLFSLTLSVGLANASARLTDQGKACSLNKKDVVAVFDPVDASLADIKIKLQVLGLTTDLAGLGEVVDAVMPATVTSFSFTRQEADQNPVRKFGPILAPDIGAAKQAVRDTVANMLDTAETALSGGSTTSTCTNPLGCLINSTLSATQALLNSILSQLSDAVPQVRKGNGSIGQATSSLIKDVVGLNLAQGQLELLYAGCPLSQRLAQ